MAGKINRVQQLQKTGSSISYNEIVKLRKAESEEFTIQGLYKYGYRNKEDISNLPASTLVVGSQNVLTNAAEQVAIRNGYQLDGPAGNQNTYGIDSNFDFNTHSSAGVQNLRKWGSNLEMRYANPVTKAVSWINIWSALIATNVVNFCSFWDGTRSQCLFVNGDLKIYKWSGALASFASATSNSVTVSGANSLANLNFDTGGNIVIDGITYAYTSAGLISNAVYSQNPTTNKITLTNRWNSQSFVTGASATQIISAVVPINSNQISNITANIRAALYTDNAGVPGTLLTSTLASIPATFGSGDFSLSFNFNWPVVAATTYHLVLSLVSSDGLVTLSCYTGNSAAVGTNFSTNSGISWSTQTGFLNAVINENDSNLQTFNGVTPDPTSAGIVVGDAIVQPPILATTSVSGAPLPSFDLIENLSNKIYYGSVSNNTVYITKTNSFTDATFSSPRLPGEGGLAVLDAPPIAFKAQATEMYISSGKSAWWQTAFTLSSDLTKESFQVTPLQTATNQGTQSQALIGKLKNSIVFVSNETIINAFGPVKDILGDPNFVNMSDPIKYDIDAYNFAGGAVYYFNYFVYVTLPKMGIERLYNVNKKYWEAPQVVPFSRHYEVSGVLFAHSGLTNESYQCYVPMLYSDNGNPINAVIAFPYVSAEGGQASQLKNFNKHYLEGYIAANTTILLTINYDFGGFSGTYTTTITGVEANIIFNKVTDGSIGQNPLGSEPIGSILNLPNQPPIPKFRIINTFPKVDCFEYQIVLSSDDVDQNWATLRSGPAVSGSDNLPVKITV